MPKLIIMVGVAGAGKTTTALKLMKYSHESTCRLCADEMRYNLYDYLNEGFKEEFENKIWQTIWNSFIQLLRKRDNILLDMTNLTKKRRMPFIHVARTFKYKIEIILFDITIIKILNQNQIRERKVPEKEICRQFMSLEYPEESEYDSIKVITNKIQVKKKNE